MGVLNPDQPRPGLQAGTRENRERAKRGEEGTIKAVSNRASGICNYFYDGLGDVYNKEDLAMIQNIRTTLDLKELRIVAALGPVRAA
jgi:hypothetical protein